MINYIGVNTPIGEMIAAEYKNKLCLLEFADDPNRAALKPLERFFKVSSTSAKTATLDETTKQLSLYFEGKLKTFKLPLIFTGSDFQKLVWQKLLEIPYGHTVSYGWIAEKINNPNSSRAVGRANGSNRISIIVPCHRIIGKDGSLTGYGGKIWRKKWLLEHEGAIENSLFLKS
jgi:O-6-methylguanine DNA methyltransferase